MTDRFSRQVRFQPFGAEGQATLERSAVWIVGIGALGSHVAETLVRAGVGHAVLIDRDVVEPSNLQRQGLYSEADAAEGRPKAPTAAQHLGAIRADAKLTPVAADYRAALHDALVATHGKPDLIVDGTDNFPTRYLINDLAVRDGIPWIYGGAVGCEGAAAVILPGATPCLRCRLPEAAGGGAEEPATCESHGVLAPAVAVVAAFQALEAIKILGGRLQAVTRGTLQHDLWRGRIGIRGGASLPDPDCPTCGRREFPALAPDAQLEVATLCGRDAVQVHARGAATVCLATLEGRLRGKVQDLAGAGSLLRFAADGVRFSVFADGRALLFGTNDPLRAQALYDRWLTPHLQS